MVEIGKYNTLEVVKILDFGIYLGDNEVEILMPTKWVPENTKIGDQIEAFVFRDSSDRLIATKVSPFATANTFAFLYVKQTNDIGAFLDWGMDKDLLVPFREQSQKMEAGKSYVVYVYVDDKTNRLVASGKLDKFIKQENSNLQINDIVDILIYSETELGFNAIINNQYKGLIFKNEIYETIRVGDLTKGFIKNIREDNKIDLSLQKSGFELVDDVKWKILNYLKKNNGILLLNDNSSPEEIKATLQISKKAYKKAIGGLYREKLISLTNKGIEIVN